MRRRSRGLAGCRRDSLWRGLGRDDRTHARPNYLLHPDRNATLPEERELPRRIFGVSTAHADARPQRPRLSRAFSRPGGNGAGRDGVRRRSRRVAPLAMDRLPAAVLFRHEIAGGAALGGGFGGERAEGAAAARNGSVSRAGAYASGFGPADGFELGARGRWLGAR